MLLASLLDGASLDLLVRLVQSPFDNLVADLVRDAVPDASRSRLAVFERLEATRRIAVEPGIERRLWDADLDKRASDRQVRGLDGADDLELFGEKRINDIEDDRRALWQRVEALTT